MGTTEPNRVASGHLDRREGGEQSLGERAGFATPPAAFSMGDHTAKRLLVYCLSSLLQLLFLFASDALLLFSRRIVLGKSIAAIRHGEGAVAVG